MLTWNDCVGLLGVAGLIFGGDVILSLMAIFIDLGFEITMAVLRYKRVIE